MIELSSGNASNVVSATAHGTVSADDYEQVLIPAITAAAADGDRIRLLYVFAEDFDGFVAGAALDDAKVGVQHWGDFERIALVTDKDAYRVLVKAFGFVFPGEVQVFDLADLDAAREWISAG